MCWPKYDTDRVCPLREPWGKGKGVLIERKKRQGDKKSENSTNVREPKLAHKEEGNEDSHEIVKKRLRVGGLWNPISGRLG